MGTYAGFCGNATIPERRRDEFNRRMLYLLEQGGMMDYEVVQICGKRLALLTSLKPDEKENLLITYNYFEDDVQEPAVYCLKNSKLRSDKIGFLQFCDVICAAYLLYEFYTTEFGIAERNGKVFDGQLYIGWLNYLFDERYTNSWIKDIHRIYSLRSDLLDQVDLASLLFDDDAKCVSHVGVVKFIAATDPDFYQGENNLEARLQKAEKDDLGHPLYPPVEKCATTEFLYYKGFSDDDLALFWKPDGDVHFSAEMTEWIKGLRTELEEIKAGPESMKGVDLLKMLVDVLDDADETYKRIFMLRDTFYKFISHSEAPIYRAAVELLRRLVERGKPEFPTTDSSRPFDPQSKQLSPARMRVKRYLAILGSPELRREVFGF